MKDLSSTLWRRNTSPETAQDFMEEVETTRSAWSSVKGQYGKRQHQQTKGKKVTKVNVINKTCEPSGKPGNTKKDCGYAKKGQSPSSIGKGKPGEADKGKNKDGKAQPVCFRSGKTGHMKKDNRSARHRDEHHLASVAQMEEPEKEWEVSPASVRSSTWSTMG